MPKKRAARIDRKMISSRSSQPPGAFIRGTLVPALRRCSHVDREDSRSRYPGLFEPSVDDLLRFGE
jgi:hypothetical protein